MQEITSVGIIGHTGMVGSAVLRYFQKAFKGEVYGYSRKQAENKEKVINSDLVFICVPTPYRWDGSGFDLSAVESALQDVRGGNIVVIKSTVPIGTTERLQEKFPDLKILFNPEFLSEATSDTDFINPDRQFVGYTAKSYECAMQVLDLLPESPYGILVPSKEAELLKYINNLHGALAVIEANHYYDVCEKEGLDYERVIKASHASKWIGAPMGRQYHNVHHKGFRGFGGACFPKDVNAWVEYCEKNGIDNTLFETVRNVNKKLLEDQGLTEEEAEKKG